jgi:hypothetical protein
MNTTYIYPSNLDVGGRDIAIAFDEQELESLVKILNKEGGPIAENLLQIFKVDQNDWACFSFHGRFICDKCGQEHIGIRMAKQIREFLTKLLKEKYPDCQSIIKKLEEKPISDENVFLYNEMSDKYTHNHRYTLKEGEYTIIPNNSYLSSAILFLLIAHFEKLMEKEKGEKKYYFDIQTGELILEEKHGKHYQEYQHDLDTAKQILEKCKTGGKRIILTKDEHSWLRHWLEEKRRSEDLWRNKTAFFLDRYDEIRDESRYEMYYINRCLRALYPDEELLHDVEEKINEVIDRFHYSKLDFNKIPPTFVNSVFKLGEHVSEGSRCENCFHDAVNSEIRHKQELSNFLESLSNGLLPWEHSDKTEKEND